MDGVYAVSESQSAILRFLTAVFQRLAELFVTTPDNHHRFLVKAALAYGPVLCGQDVPAQANTTLSQNLNYRDSLLLGMPVVQAYLGERSAPPFGVFVHESARAFAPVDQRPLFCLWWNWFQQSQPLAVQLRTELLGYFEWCQARALAIAYDVERIKVHKEQASQYLVDVVDSPGQVSGLH